MSTYNIYYVNSRTIEVLGVSIYSYMIFLEMSEALLASNQTKKKNETISKLATALK